MILAGIVLGAASLLAAEGIDVLDGLRPEHPRLMLTDAGLNSLKSAYETDGTLRDYVDQVLKQAEAVISDPSLEHKLIGPRLLHVSRDCLRRIYSLALAWRWTGDERFARAAESNLLTVAAFPDWNPSHFLDTAEMSHAVGIGYDWLYGYLGEDSRGTIKAALIAKGLQPGIAVYTEGKKWTLSDFNWNQVCNGGMMIGSLAIAETDPEHARFILPKAIASLPIALRSYDPDGAWMEGPSYWSYATRYTAYAICGLDTALGKDFGLSDSPGLRASGTFPTYTTGPTGLVLNYADSGERGRRGPLPCMFWLAGKYANPAFSDAEHAVVAEHKADPAHLVWYQPPTGKRDYPRDLDRWFRSSVDVIVMRSAWDDPNALFVGVKGGFNQVNHGHLDLGNFEMDALGVRWARDLGSDDYNLPGYWDKKKGGERWKFYRLNTASHNVPMLNGRNQDEEAVAKVLDFRTRPDAAYVSLDLTSAYKDFASNAIRDVAITNDRRAVVVRDRFELTAPSDILWGMTTDARITLRDDGSALLELDGKELVARIAEPTGASFTVESAERQPPEKENKGVSRLVVRIPAASGTATVTVLLAPVWPDGAVESADLNALDE